MCNTHGQTQINNNVLSYRCNPELELIGRVRSLDLIALLRADYKGLLPVIRRDVLSVGAMAKSPEEFAEFISSARNKIFEWVPETGGKSIVVDTRVQIRKLVGEMADHMNIMCGMLFNMREILAKSEKTAVEAEKVASAAEVKVAAAEGKVVEAEKRVAEAAKTVSTVNDERAPGAKISYAKACKKNEVIVKSGADKLTSEQVKCHFMTCVDPVNSEIGVARITRLRNGAVKINCPAESDVEKIKKALDGNENVHVKERALKRPWMKLPRIDLHDSEDEIIGTIFKQNGHIREAFPTEAGLRENLCFKRAVKVQQKDKKMMIIEVSRELRQLLLKRPLYYRFKSVWVQDNRDIQQCYNCYAFGHMSKDCNVKQIVCGKCGGNGHKYRECKSRKTCCAVCTRFNAENPTKKAPTDHEAKSYGCPQYRRRREILDEQIDF